MANSTWEVAGADGQTITIPKGEWYLNTKARCRRMAQNSLSPEARRVYACLELGTMGFSQEKAVAMVKVEGKDETKIVPMTPARVRELTGISKQHVRRAIEELEDAGLMERRSVDGGTLRNGKVELFSWAVPRAAENKKRSSQRAATLPGWIPESWEPIKSLITRLKLTLSEELPPDMNEGAALGYFEQVAQAARDYQKAEEVVSALLERVRAQSKKRAHINKEERNRKEHKRKEQSSSSAVDLPTVVEAKADEEEDPLRFYPTLKSLYPADHFDEPKAKPSFEGLSLGEKRECIKRLQLYLECERWKADKGRWIPLCSNWLKSYEADPPPPLVPRARTGELAPAEDVLALMRYHAIVKKISDDPEQNRKLAQELIDDPRAVPPDMLDWAREVIDA